MTTQAEETAPEEVLQHEADIARQRLLSAIDRLDSRAKTWVQHAAENTRVSGWGIVGAVAFWAGVVAVTRRRQRSRAASSALVLRARPSIAARLALQALRGSAALVGFFASRAFALRVIAQQRAFHAGLSSDLPHVRHPGDTDALLLPAQPVPAFETRGTPNA